MLLKPSFLRLSFHKKKQNIFWHLTKAFTSKSWVEESSKGSPHQKDAKSSKFGQDSLSISSTLTLNDQVKIPRFGLGVFDINEDTTRRAVLWALQCGYRQIDTASRYRNEKGVGEAIRESTINREKIFVVTKVYHEDHGYDSTLKAFEKSLSLLGLNFVDLYLIHFPVPASVVQTWKAMVELKEMGLIRSIGVSNFNVHHLEALRQQSDILPSVNQIEIHPFLQEQTLVNYCAGHGIAVQAYSPLTRGKKLHHPVVLSVAQKYRKTPAQVLLRWCIQKGYVCIPKSSHFDRIKENAAIFEFEILAQDIQVLDSLEQGFRIGRDKILWPWNG